MTIQNNGKEKEREYNLDRVWRGDLASSRQTAWQSACLGVWGCGAREDEKGFCAVRTIDDIRAQDIILTPGRYVGIAEQEDDGEPFENKMKRLTTELSGLFEQSHKLEEEIRKQLGSIGFNV